MSQHGYTPTIKLRYLTIFGRKTYIQITPARGRCEHCKGNPTTTQVSEWYYKVTDKQRRMKDIYCFYLLTALYQMLILKKILDIKNSLRLHNSDIAGFNDK
jgi:transposase